MTVTGLCCLEEVAPTRGQARVAGEDQCTPLRLRGPRGRGHRRLCHDGQKALGHVLRLVWREEPPLPPILLLMEHRAGSDGDGSDDGSDVGLTPGVCVRGTSQGQQCPLIMVSQAWDRSLVVLITTNAFLEMS